MTMYKFTRYWLTTVLASEGVDAHEAGQIFDYGQTGEEGMMWFEGHGPSEGYGVIEGEYSDEKFRINVNTGIPYPWEPPPRPLPPDAVIGVARRNAAKAIRDKLVDLDADGIDSFVDANLNGTSPQVRSMFKDILKLLATVTR
jgi:hypothetical protein